jgi:hypothetical protein
MELVRPGEAQGGASIPISSRRNKKGVRLRREETEDEQAGAGRLEQTGGPRLDGVSSRRFPKFNGPLYPGIHRSTQSDKQPDLPRRALDGGSVSVVRDEGFDMITLRHRIHLRIVIHAHLQGLTIVLAD